MLHDVLTAKKSRTWVKVLEAIMFRYIDISVELQLHRHAKDGLHQYRNISQQQAPQSLEAVIQHLLATGEKRVAKAAAEAKKKNLSAGAGVKDLENEQSPESIMLSTMTDEGDGDRSEREVLVPWLKFLWETRARRAGWGSGGIAAVGGRSVETGRRGYFAETATWLVRGDGESATVRGDGSRPRRGAIGGDHG